MWVFGGARNNFDSVLYLPEYADIEDHANSVDPDQTAPKEQSDLGLHCLPTDPLLYELFLYMENVFV